MAKKSDTATPAGWHFPPETFTFLSDLKANNTKAWFAGNKTAYEKAIKHPAKAFCTHMEGALQALTGRAHNSKIFRIHRDLRFSKDKTPYNTHLHISFFPEAAATQPPAWHFGLEPGKLGLGTGIFAFEKAGLALYRDRVAGPDGDDLSKLLAGLDRDGIRFNEPELKRGPPGFDPDHANSDLLRRKGLTAWLEVADPGTAVAPGIVTECAVTFKRLKPVFDWLMPG